MMESSSMANRRDLATKWWDLVGEKFRGEIKNEKVGNGRMVVVDLICRDAQ